MACNSRNSPLTEQARNAIWGALTILRLLYVQQQARGTGGYAHVLKGDIDRLEAAYAALGEETS